FSSRSRHTRFSRDWSSDVCSSDLAHVGESMLTSAGLADWIASDEDDFIRKAAAFAADVPGLAALRGRQRAQVVASPLCDARRFRSEERRVGGVAGDPGA